ncbi:MAG: PEP-CTERM sorting domain-containing protein [Candidatus Competibacteraceae bacterium]
MKNAIVVHTSGCTQVWEWELLQIIRSHVLLLLVTLLTVPITSYASLIYSVDRSIGEGHVQGTITTNGKTGILGSIDFIDWSLNIFDLSHSTILTPQNSHLSAENVIGTYEDLSIDADATDISTNAWIFLASQPSPSIGWLIDHIWSGLRFYNDEYILTSRNPDQDYLQGGLTGRVIFAVAQIPEPSILGLFGVGTVGLIARRLCQNHRLRKKGARLDLFDSPNKGMQPTRYARG